MSSQPPSFICRTSTGIEIYETGESFKPVHKDERPCKTMKYSNDGNTLVVVYRESVEIRDGSGTILIRELSVPGVNLVEFSPCNTFIVTNAKGIIQVWRVEDGSVALEHKAKTNSWPFIQWSQDEVIAMRTVSNEVHIFDGQLVDSRVIKRIIVPNVSSSVIAPGPPPYEVSCYCSEYKGAPASVKLFNYPAEDDTAVGHRSFFRVQGAQLLWNKLGTALLIWTHADVDVSGKSYYGETRLYFMRGDGSKDETVPLDKEGQIHDVQWSPTGREFAVVFGFTPAKTMLFNQFCEPVFDFGLQARNTMLWAPHGRFLCVCGLGTMAGEMEFWDRNKLKIIGRAQADVATTALWSPDSRMFVTGSLAPRMRVDNGLVIMSYYGKKLHEIPFKELLGVSFRPCLDYPDRPASPDIAKGRVDSAATTEKPKVQAYRPPGARKDPNWKPSAAFDRVQDSRGPRKITAAAPVASGAGVGVDGRVVVGYVEPSSTKSSSAKRRERRKAKEKEAVVVEVPKLPAVEDAAVLGKRLRNLSKKLRQIQALKQTSDLTDEQKEKVKTEASIQEEMESIEEKIAKLQC